MLDPRIIPCLLIQDNGLVKTINFGSPKYVGDSINAVKIFNEMQTDELIVLDIDATVKKIEPDYKMIEHIASECRMPLCYGGGIKNCEQASRILSLGVEKISIGSLAVESPEIIESIAMKVGMQSVVVVVDIKKKLFRGYEVVTHNGKVKTGIDPVDFVRRMQDIGIGEIVLNSVDKDGTMSGYDYKMVEELRSHIFCPMTILGGAGSIEDIGELINRFGIVGASAGSLFVFKGKYRAVLINYPSQGEKRGLIEKYL
jgi:imidazole glycerol-phosphate synthase subunit HisF